jgi:hypothetical protein
MKKIEGRMEDLGIWAREGVKGSGAVECFLRDHTEKMTYRYWPAAAKAEMR